MNQTPNIDQINKILQTFTLATSDNYDNFNNNNNNNNNNSNIYNNTDINKAGVGYFPPRQEFNYSVENIKKKSSNQSLNNPLNNPYANFARPLATSNEVDKRLPPANYVPPKDRMNSHINDYQFNAIFSDPNTPQSQYLTNNFIDTSNQMNFNSRMANDFTRKDEINTRLSGIDKIGKTVVFNRLNNDNQTNVYDVMIPKTSY